MLLLLETMIFLIPALVGN